MTILTAGSAGIPILGVPRDGEKTLEDLLALRDAHDIRGTLYVADFHVTGAEDWQLGPGGWRHPTEPVVNVDHHAPHRAMQRRVSSANLALELLAAGAGPAGGDAVVLSHMDCDSVLSGGILSGRLEPDARYGAAAIAADHTGEPDPIAELLQALDAHWTRTGAGPMPDPRGLEEFLEALGRHERGVPLSDFARAALAARSEARMLAEAVARERMEVERGVAFAELGAPMEGELFLPHLSDAWMVLTANPLTERPDTHWQMKLRLSAAAPEWLSLHDLGIGSFDPAYGGRWNAGSNNRRGGTEMDPGEYRERVVSAVDARVLEHAIGIAVEAHRGQRDKSGAPYILHPLRVMEACRTPEARMVAVLHDVVEDTGWTLSALRREGFPEEVLEGIEAVTKRPEEEGSEDGYLAFCRRAALHPIGREVKLADLADNLDASRLREVTDVDRARMERYERAQRVLMGEWQGA